MPFVAYKKLGSFFAVFIPDPTVRYSRLVVPSTLSPISLPLAPTKEHFFVNVLDLSILAY